jgi:hypothetical protein
MKGLYKQIASKVLLGIVVLILFHLNNSALTYCNDSYSAFLEIDKKQENSAVETIKGYVVGGAGYFLESYSDFVLFLNKIEIGELGVLNYDELKMILDNAIKKMEYAKNEYIHLKKKADDTPYNQNVVQQLLKFNYEVFQKRNRLIGPVFNRVQFFLSSGDIREMYGDVLSQTVEILNIANLIKTKIEAKEFPDLSNLYRLNEVCSESLIFSQYVARVFRKLSKVSVRNE